MHYIWHYNIMGVRALDLKQKLETSYGIHCEETYNIEKTTLVAIHFDIEETHPHFQKIVQFISASDWGERYNSEFNKNPTCYFPVYSDEEFLSAKWLAIRSSFSKVLLEALEGHHTPTCIFGKDKWGYDLGRHIINEGSYTLKSPIKWNRNHFASEDEHTLFCDDLARAVLEKNDISGIRFRPVKKSSTGLPMENIHHLTHTFTVPNGCIVGLRYTEEYVCPQCGMNMILKTDPRYRWALRAGSIPEELDYCRTLPMFTFAEYKHSAHDYPLVSQKLYRLLKEYSLDRSLWFEPIDVV